MKIIAILGSPNRNGNTSTLAREALRGASEKGAEVEEVFLADYRIEYCRGCISRNIKDFCLSTGKCIIPDDAEEIRRKLYESDGIILATPTYGIQPTARMKNFMTDRIGMFNAYSSRLAGKYLVGIATAGGVGAKKTARDLVWGYSSGFFGRSFISGYIGVHIGYGRIEDFPEEMKKARELGRRMATDICTGRSYPFQNLPGRFLIRCVIRPIILKNLLTHREGIMKAVYEDLIERKLLPEMNRNGRHGESGRIESIPARQTDE